MDIDSQKAETRWSRWSRYWAAFVAYAEAMEMNVGEYQDIRIARLKADIQELKRKLADTQASEVH